MHWWEVVVSATFWIVKRSLPHLGMHTYTVCGVLILNSLRMGNAWPNIITTHSSPEGTYAYSLTVIVFIHVCNVTQESLKLKINFRGNFRADCYLLLLPSFKSQWFISAWPNHYYCSQSSRFKFLRGLCSISFTISSLLQGEHSSEQPQVIQLKLARLVIFHIFPTLSCKSFTFWLFFFFQASPVPSA